MSGDKKDLKDTKRDLVKDIFSMPSMYQTYVFSPSILPKLNKLVTALYMVTDILDLSEPIRSKLRSLATDILSDTYQLATGGSTNKYVKVIAGVDQIQSFLGIASTIGIISDMNAEVLKKEFSGFKISIERQIEAKGAWSQAMDISEFLREELSVSTPKKMETKVQKRVRPTRLGIQKAGTFLQVLSDTTASMSNIKFDRSPAGFDTVKKDRRNQILSIIKNNRIADSSTLGLTITDIKSKAGGRLASTSEKTLQRELISMVKDNVLYKTGSKRWSRYSIPD